jgi:PDZ domain
VHSVEPGSPAHAAGGVPGDVLIRAGGRELRSSSSLYAAIQDAGERLTVTLLRGNEELPVRIALDGGDDVPVTARRPARTPCEDRRTIGDDGSAFGGSRITAR